MKVKALLSLMGIIVLGITACGDNGTTSSATPAIESEAVLESSVTEESESVIESMESAGQIENVESAVGEKDDTQFVGLVEDGVFSITDVISEAEEIIVPDNIDGVTVGKIKKEAFYDLQCKKIVIPNTVTSIGKSAFLNCVNLETIELGTGITSVGASAFSGCKQLKSVTFADGLVTIKGTIFYDCRALEEAFIPASATDIEHGLGNAETCPNLVIVTPSGSRAEEVANSQGVPVRNS